EHQIFEDHTQPASTHFAVKRKAGDRIESVIRKTQTHVLIFEQTLILLDDGVLRTRENLNQGRFVQIFESGHDREAPDELGNEAIADQILRLKMLEQINVTPFADTDRPDLFVSRLVLVEAHRLLPSTLGDDALETDESA